MRVKESKNERMRAERGESKVYVTKIKSGVVAGETLGDDSQVWEGIPISEKLRCKS